MKNTGFKTFIIWLFSVFMFSLIAAGQTLPTDGEAILVNGSVPLTRRMANDLEEVFSWILGSRFTENQRSQFQNILIAEWRKSDPKIIETFQGYLKLRAQLVNATNEQRIAAHKELQPTFVRGLKEPPVDEMSKLLLSVYDVGKSGVLNQPSNQVPVENDNNQAGGIPPEMVGEWIARRGSGSSYTNPNTGSYGAPNATTESYKVFADGTYEHAILMQSSLYNCSTRIFGRETGTIIVGKNVFTITPGPGTLDYYSSCNSSLNEKKTTKVEQESLYWRIERDEQGLKLCVQNAKGASACYYKQ